MFDPKILICPICTSNFKFHAVVPFDRKAGDFTEIEFVKCFNCGFIKAPEFDSWSTQRWSSEIYNNGYGVVVDAGTVNRQHKYADKISKIAFTNHLDFGGGNGTVSKILVEQFNKQSQSYDPFHRFDGDFDLPNHNDSKFSFDLISAIEVLEHLTDPNSLFESINKVTNTSSRLIATTKLLSNFDSNCKFEDFWYVNPRAGHICFYTIDSLKLLAEKHGWELVVSVDDEHFFIKN